MNGVLLDTDIVIEVLRKRDSGILARWLQLAATAEAVFYTTVTADELWQGLRKGEEDAVLRLLSTMTCLPLSLGVGRTAGEYLRRYAPSHGLELGDAPIDAAAVLHGHALWTRNRKHYPMADIELF